jgi:hypothetical protein
MVSHANPAAFNGAGLDPTLVVRGLEDFLSPVRKVVNMVFLCCLCSGLGVLDAFFIGTASVGGAANAAELIWEKLLER